MVNWVKKNISVFCYISVCFQILTHWLSVLTCFFLVVIRASGNSTFTCPDIFSLARIILLKVFNKTLVARRTTLSFSVARGDDQTTVKFEPCTDITVHKSLLNGWKEFFYLMMHSTHFYVRLFGVWYVVKDHSEVRKETHCHHMGYSFRLAARNLLYAPSHRQLLLHQLWSIGWNKK